MAERQSKQYIQAVGINRWVGALRQRNFRVFFIGQAASQIGTGMAPVAIAFAVLEHGSASDVGYVLAAETLPLVLFLLIGGVIADKFSRRLVMLSSDVLRFAAEGALGVWILMGTPPLWGFLVLAALLGSGMAFFTPAMTGLVPQIVEDAHLQQGNALNGLAESGGRVVGPALAGVIIATSSPGWAVLVDALSYLVSVVSLAMVRADWSVIKPSDTFLVLLRQGWQQFWDRTWLWVVVVQSSIVNMLIFAPYFVLGPVVAKEHLRGATAWGAVLASLGVGALVGGAIMLRVHPRRPLLVAMLTSFVWAFPLVAMAYPVSTVAIAIGSFLGGGAMSVFGALWNTTMQREIPVEVLSRVSAYDWFGSLVFLPLGMAAVGPLAASFGAPAVFVTAAVFTVVLTAAVLMVPSVTRLQAPKAA
jgi:MFS family permease